MKKLCTLLGVLLFVSGSAQTTNVTYKTSTLNFSNPERGFYKHTSAGTGTYKALTQTTITNYRVLNNISLIYRAFPLNDFIDTPISESYLANMQSDFDKIRKAGIKCFIRFTYSDDQDVPKRDATKEMMLTHIKQIKPLLQANEDVISLMQAGFIGAWGEWYYTSQADFGGEGYDGLKATTTNINNRKEIVEALLDALPASRMLQVRTPTFKQGLYSKNALTTTQAFSETSLARIGHHNDCFLASSSDYGTYNDVTTQYPYLAQDTKFVPMGGETCTLNSPRTDCATALSEMKKFHWSFLNLDYYPGVIDGFEANNCFTDVQKELGYRFQLTTATFPKSQLLKDKLPITLKIINSGFAAPFNERKAYLVLKNLATNQVFSILMASDPRTWLGPTELTINENLTLPTNLTTGNYKLYLHLPDNMPTLANRSEYAIRFANDNIWDATTGYNDLNYTINVTDINLGTVDSSKINMTIYPIPSNNELTVEFEGINDYQITMFNSLGQNVIISKKSEANKTIINTSNLSEGLYFLEFAKGAFRDTRKIIIKH
ncbi:DUF4832 domain-containing protein [Flavobacterium myungsuense]|uniref:DUF4832 domain-containing protein n=1 Tax=Flavobacterium myungsuense TaxID=651823 RepID=A0ABW3J2Z7_9FLAO